MSPLLVRSAVASASRASHASRCVVSGITSSSSRLLSTTPSALNAPKAPSTPVTTAGHYGASGDESQGRDLPAEQKSRQELAVDASATSDAPPELHQRSVRIFKPAKTANSSGKAGTNHWRVDWDILQGSARWENPLIGWASSADYMQGTSVKFRTKEDAIRFCEKQGWDYFVQEPHYSVIGPKSYAANYKYEPAKKLRIHHTK